MRDIKFIDHEPPEPGTGNKPRGSVDWSPYVAGVLTSEPGRWAIIESAQANADANILTQWATRNGFPLEAVSRDGVLYARVTA